VSPYPSGALPTLLVRSKVAELLAVLPIYTSHETTRDVLMRSGLGRLVQFHAAHSGDGTERERAGRLGAARGGGAAARPQVSRCASL
jgi:hypothetical protein